ncbi:hypothetical protein GCM10010917_34330 [Paenibacillus physcomitrellae]|uniref:Uncharacterized protein n=1 Tax=Paenibacillus physcomitrellae TaxID=1619311 RepID=A0ABQ1GM28_9BACL|nr:hypothetical protein GCM10010917_34330 [Paenibacillus physcomitrellae]
MRSNSRRTVNISDVTASAHDTKWRLVSLIYFDSIKARKEKPKVKKNVNKGCGSLKSKIQITTIAGMIKPIEPKIYHL